MMICNRCGETKTTAGYVYACHICRSPNDGTVRLLTEYGIPVTRENYLMLAFAGKPPEEPLDGEVEAQLPEYLQKVR